MQLLESDNNKRYEKKCWKFTLSTDEALYHLIHPFRFSSYWIFQKSGRIGTIIGKTDQQEYNSIEHAEREFRKIFKDLTGNDFNPYAKFEKQPEKYHLLKIECEAQQDVLKSLVPTNLEARNYGLMQLICDQKAMKDTMLSFDLDVANMPLGKFDSKMDFVHDFLLYW